MVSKEVVVYILIQTVVERKYNSVICICKIHTILSLSYIDSHKNSQSTHALCKTSGFSVLFSRHEQYA